MKRTYADYSGSESESLGEIPSHWEVARLRDLTTYRTSSVDKKSDPDEHPVRLCNYTDVYYRDQISANDDGFMEATASAHEIDQFGLQVGDVLITKDSEDWTDIAVPAIVKATANDFVCGYHLGIVRPIHNLESAFLFHALQSKGVNVQLQTAATGVTRYGIPKEAVKQVVVPLPPLDEQRTIAAYLDSETARIDQLISKQELLMERLGEYRTALINQVVTKGLPPEAAEAAGLNPTPGFKESGVEWLGRVPEHWTVRRLKHIARYFTSSVDKKTVEGEMPVRLCNYTDVYYRERIRADEGDYMRATATRQEVARFRLQSGDLLITKDSEDWRDIAVPAFVENSDVDFVCGYHLGMFRTGRLLDSGFALRVFQSQALNQQLQISASGVTRYGLQNSSVENALTVVPPVGEQRAIAHYLDTQSAHINALRAKAELSIERLQEYRSALVSAAVTGKIDVRDAVSAGGGV